MHPINQGQFFHKSCFCKMTTTALVSRRFSRWLTRFSMPLLPRIGSSTVSRRKRQAWVDLVHSSAHLQHDLGLIDTLPERRGR